MTPKVWAGKLPGYIQFFAPLQVALDPGDYERVEFAYALSKYGHRGQIRDGGERYFDHPKGAAWIYMFEYGGRDPRLIIDLLLHDISEDTRLLSPHRLRVNFGIDIALDVQGMTKLPPGIETTPQYLERIIIQGSWDIAAKLFDRNHNMRTLGSCTPEKQAAQIAETQRYHLPMLVPALRKYGEPWTPLANGIESDILAIIERMTT